jgi:hypothetical protein
MHEQVAAVAQDDWLAETQALASSDGTSRREATTGQVTIGIDGHRVDHRAYAGFCPKCSTQGPFTRSYATSVRNGLRSAATVHGWRPEHEV